MRDLEGVVKKLISLSKFHKKEFSDGINGAYILTVKPNIRLPSTDLLCIVSDGISGLQTKWEHVSVSVRHSNRLPTWDEMNAIKDVFWSEEEVVLQIHPKKSDYVNIAQVLHLWRKVGENFESPPKILV